MSCATTANIFQPIRILDNYLRQRIEKKQLPQQQLPVHATEEPKWPTQTAAANK